MKLIVISFALIVIAGFSLPAPNLTAIRVDANPSVTTAYKTPSPAPANWPEPTR